jgi:hypothetical protein
VGALVLWMEKRFAAERTISVVCLLLSVANGDGDSGCAVVSNWPARERPARLPVSKIGVDIEHSERLGDDVS